MIEFLRQKSSVQTPTNRRPFAGQRGNQRRNPAPPPPTQPLKGLRPATSHMDLRAPIDDSDRQVDISLPSTQKTNQITQSDIESYLTGHGITINELGVASDDSYFHRMTITLKQSLGMIVDLFFLIEEFYLDVDRLLRAPIQEHKGVVMKFKRTKSSIDSKSFLVKISIDDENEKIALSHLRTYIDQLIDRHSIKRITDLSTDSEQILYIQCTNNISKSIIYLFKMRKVFFVSIDFNGILQKNFSQPQFSGKDITVNQVYQCDSITVHCCDDQPIDGADLKFIFQSFLSDIFVYEFPSKTYAQIEFIDANSKISLN